MGRIHHVGGTVRPPRCGAELRAFNVSANIANTIFLEPTSLGIGSQNTILSGLDTLRTRSAHLFNRG